MKALEWSKLGNFSKDAWHNGAVNNQKDVDLPLVSARIWRFRANLIFAVAGFFFALVLALGAVCFSPLIIGLVALLAVLVILGWSFLIELPSRQTARIDLIIISVLGILAAIFADYHWIALVAGLGIVISFATEMFRAKTLLRRLEQISGTYLAMVLVLSSVFWIQSVNTGFDAQVVFVFAVVIGVVSIINLFITRSVFAISLVNALIFGFGTAFLTDTRLAAGAIAGLAVPVAYRLSYEAFNQAHYERPLMPLLAYIVLPISSLGFIAYATAGMLGGL